MTNIYIKIEIYLTKLSYFIQTKDKQKTNKRQTKDKQKTNK